MSRLDTYYRAFHDLRRNTREDRDCAALRKIFVRAGAESDKIEVIRTVCKIEDDWISAIEEGLVHIGKAIAEERQFILSNGEVVPIEKVKFVSRESVEHLSKHSNLLTKERADGDIVPDKLYTVERLNDYAVYENRFLYMLLCFLRDFITYRYEKLTELANTYRGSLQIKKQADGDGRRSETEIVLNEVITDDPFLAETNPAREKLERISDILKNVMVYLATPLMEAVAKSPMLKPPITETNVLKMNKNFRGAVQLYYFISAYDRDGYTLEEEVRTVRPFPDLVADEFADAVALLSFLTYEHGMDISETLRARFREEERRRREAEEERRREQLEKLRRRIRESGGSPEEYMLLLEQRNRVLEEDSAQLRVARGEIARLTSLSEQQAEECERLNAALSDSARELREREAAHRAQVASLEEEHSRAVQELCREHEERLRELGDRQQEELRAVREQSAAAEAELRARHTQETEELRAQCERALEESINAHRAEVEKLQADHAAQCTEYDARLAAAGETERQQAAQLAAAREQLGALDEAHARLSAQYTALRKQQGLLTEADDFSSREKFGELEKQYEAFRRLFREEWKKAKRGIRREVFREVRAKAAAQGGAPAPSEDAQAANRSEEIGGNKDETDEGGRE